MPEKTKEKEAVFAAVDSIPQGDCDVQAACMPRVCQRICVFYGADVDTTMMVSGHCRVVLGVAQEGHQNVSRDLTRKILQLLG